MSAIWKFPVNPALEDRHGVIQLALPKGAVILHCAMQAGVPTIWALCDERLQDKENRRFKYIMTGEPFEPQSPTVAHLQWKYIATLFKDHLVLHLWELP